MNPIEYLTEFYTSLNTPGLILFWSILFLFFFLIFSVVALLVKNNELNKTVTKLKKGDRGIVTPAPKEESKSFEKVVIKGGEKVQQTQPSVRLDNRPLRIKTDSPSSNYQPERPVSQLRQEEMNNVRPQPRQEVNEVVEEDNLDDTFWNEDEPGSKAQSVDDRRDTNNGSLYQKNVLREMSAKTQTSPISIGIKKDVVNLDDIGNTKMKPISVSDVSEDEYYDNVNNGSSSFLEEISKQIESELEPREKAINLTQYEQEQEEEAIISYNDLVKAVQKNETREERYKFDTNDDDDFLNELKSFRNNM